MDIERKCKTCEYCKPNGNGSFLCDSIAGKFKEIIDYEKELPCWKISIKQWCELVSLLPYNLREIYVNEVGGRGERALFKEFNATNTTDLLINMVKRLER